MKMIPARFLYRINNFYQLLLGFMLVSLFCVSFTNTGVAQEPEEQIKVLIARPGEGETFYAGESSLVYSMRVIGYVSLNEHFPKDEMDRVELKLQVWQADQLIDELSTKPTKDGRFTFALTVNPDNSLGGFPPEYEPACIICHYTASHVLPRGDVLLRVVAYHPEAGQAIDERRVFADLSQIVQFPVKVVLESDPQRVVPDIPVQATTRLYQWRSRTFLGKSGLDGKATLPLECLIGSPTEYIIRVDPVIVDGVLYYTTENADLTLEHPYKQPTEIILQVHSQLGSVDGAVEATRLKQNDNLIVKLINLSNGSNKEVQIDAMQRFSFSGIPLDQYLLMADYAYGDPDAKVGVPPLDALAYLDLEKNTSSSVELSVPGITDSLRGSVEYKGSSLPFVWVKLQENGVSQAVDPLSGRFFLRGQNKVNDTLLVSAPGFYTRVIPVKPEDWETALDPIELKIQENTVSIPWGSGEIIVPQESRIVRGSDLILQSGWLFGCGQGQTINISVNDYIIDLQNGCFGLEYLPGESAWFFLFEGAAKLLHSGQSDPISITAATMINLGLEDALSQAVYDPQIIAAIRGLHQKSIPISWEPTFLARVRDMLASLGVGTAQALTYASYMVMLSLLVIIPIIFFKHWRYNLSSASMRMNANDEEVK